MKFSHKNNEADLPWWDLIADEQDLGEGLEELTHDSEAGVVAAVGIFTMLKLRFWHRLPGPISDAPQINEHQSDDTLPPKASICSTT